MRTHMCGEPRPTDIGSTVTVCGWVARRREHGEHLAFVDLRDHTGLLQCVVDGSVDVRSEYVLSVTGVVSARPEGTVNDKLPTGEVELTDCTVEVLSAAEPPPFPLDERAAEVDENIRLRHRYLDLRRPEMQRNLRRRAAVSSAIRSAMDEQGFVEVETPMLIASTPEGARDFVVPSRLHPGSFYALPQSPQLFKQLCMVGGIDRYYQMARCMRDEDLRADRQFEFTQLDLRDELRRPTGRARRGHRSRWAQPWRQPRGSSIGDIPRITWHEAMERFGSDKPDVRFDMELTDLTDVFAGTGLQRLQGRGRARGYATRAHRPSTSRGRLDDLTDTAKRWGAKGLVWMRVRRPTVGE